ILILPQVRRTESIGQMQEILPVHDWLLEALARHREFLFGNAQIVENLLREALRPLAVEALYERNTFVTRDVQRANFLRGVVGRAADADLDEGREVVDVVDAVVDAVVLAVGAGRALGRGLEAAVRDRVVVAALR